MRRYRLQHAQDPEYNPNEEVKQNVPSVNDEGDATTGDDGKQVLVEGQESFNVAVENLRMDMRSEDDKKKGISKECLTNENVQGNNTHLGQDEGEASDLKDAIEMLRSDMTIAHNTPNKEKDTVDLHASSGLVPTNEMIEATNYQELGTSAETPSLPDTPGSRLNTADSTRIHTAGDGSQPALHNDRLQSKNLQGSQADGPQILKLTEIIDNVEEKNVIIQNEGIQEEMVVPEIFKVEEGLPPQKSPNRDNEGQEQSGTVTENHSDGLVEDRRRKSQQNKLHLSQIENSIISLEVQKPDISNKSNNIQDTDDVVSSRGLMNAQGIITNRTALLSTISLLSDHLAVIELHVVCFTGMSCSAQIG